MRLALDAAVELERLVHRYGLPAHRRHLDVAFDQADDLVAGTGAAPQSGAADAGGDLRGADAPLALAALGDEVGGEAERALEHVERGFEEIGRRIQLGEAELAVLAELNQAAVGELDERARATAGDEL